MCFGTEGIFIFCGLTPLMKDAIIFAWRKFSSIQERGDEWKSRRDKILSLGRLPMEPPLEYSIIHKRLSLGMPKASPFSSTIISFTRVTIFLFIFTLCVILRASVCFYFQFVYGLFSGHINVGSYYYCLGEKNTLVLHLYMFSIKFSLFLASSSCFSRISCLELLVLL